MAVLSLRSRYLIRNRKTIFISLVFATTVFLYLSACSKTSSSCDSSGSAEDAGDQHRAFLVILLMVAPTEYAERRAIRETWLSSYGDDVVVLFAIGTATLPVAVTTTLLAERDRHTDMLLMADFADGYYHLTDKLLRSFQWIAARYDFAFLFKADADTFARLPLLLSQLRGYPDARRLYWGFFDGRARVKLGANRWSESRWTLCDRYTPHALGGGYVLSADLVRFISTNADFLQRFNSEDVSVGAWLGALDIRRVHDPRFDTEYRSRGCDNRYLVTHKQSPAAMSEKHASLRQHGVLCPREFQDRRSYVYNWEVEPSRCCIRNDSKIP